MADDRVRERRRRATCVTAGRRLWDRPAGRRRAGGRRRRGDACAWSRSPCSPTATSCVEDVPGTGKTLLARAVARALDLDTARIQGTPDLLPSDVTGASLFEPGGPPLRRRARCSRTSCSSTRSTGRRRGRSRRCWRRCRSARSRSRARPAACPDPFVVLATQNPVEFEGTFALPAGPARPVPAARPDRLPGRRRRAPDRPPPPGRRGAARRDRARHRPRAAARPSATGSGRCASPTRSRRTSSSSSGRRATHPDIELGASPRATVALYRAAQAAAVLEGRDVRHARRRQGRSPRPCWPTGWSSTSTGASTARRPTRALAAILGHGRRPAGARRLTRAASRHDADAMTMAAVLLAIALIVIGSVLDVPIAIVLGLGRRCCSRSSTTLWARAGLRGVRYTPDARRAARGVRRRDPDARSRSGTGDGCRSPGCAPTTTRRTGVDRPRARPRDGDERGSRGPAQRLDAAAVRARRAPVPRRARDRRGVFTRSGRSTCPSATRSPGGPRSRSAPRSTRSSSGRGPSPTTEIEPPDRWGDLDRARPGLAEDPSRFAGVRPYAPGDPIRRIHARTSARLGRPMTKRFEPSRDREVLIALDVQTVDGPAWEARPRRATRSSRCTSSPASLARTLGAAAGRVRPHGGRLHRRRDADRAGRRVVGAGPGPSASSTSSRGCRSTPRCRSSGCSRSSRARVPAGHDGARPHRPRPAAVRAGAAAARAGRRPTSSSSPAARRRIATAARARSLGFTARRAVHGRPLAHRRAAGRDRRP